MEPGRKTGRTDIKQGQVNFGKGSTCDSRRGEEGDEEGGLPCLQLVPISLGLV